MAKRPASPERPPRSDAVRNRTRVIAAAREVFAERGLSSTMAEVAERAGVGNATVFRHFPTKADLLSEIATGWLERWRDEIERQVAEHPDGDVLRVLIGEVIEWFRNDQLALDILRTGDLDKQMRTARAAVERLFTAALTRGKDAGLIDPAASYDDLHLLIVGMAARLSERGDSRPASWRRAADLAWSAISR